MTAEILAVLLISGYAFIIHSPYQKYKLENTSGWITYLYAIYRGVYFGIFAFVLVLILHRIFPAISEQILLYTWYGLTFVSALCIGLAVKTFRWMNNKATEKIIKDSSLRQIIYQSIQGNLLQVTLSTGKVYVGLVLKITPEFLSPDMEYIRLTPLFSGYRKSETLNIVLDNQYTKFYGDSDQLSVKELRALLSNFSILLPLKDVVHIGLFDIKAFQTISPSEKE